MAEVSLLVMLAIVLVSAIVVFRVAKSVIQGVLLASAVLSILAAVAGGFVVKDAFELKDNFQKNDNTLLLSDDNWAKLTGGITIKGQADGQGGQAAEKADGKVGNAVALTAAELERLNPLFAKKDYGAMLGKNYKLIVMKESSVAGSLLGSGGEEPGESNGVERAAMLAALLSIRASQDPVFIISEYKKGNAIVYPETPVFKAIKVMPLSLFKNAAAKVLRKAADASKDVATKAVAAVSTAAAET